MSAQAALRKLQRDLKGTLILPGYEEYDAARKVWNGIFDRHPKFIARCLDTGDVSAVIRYARTNGLPVTVRCGGHNVAGKSIADDAVLLDLSLMRNVKVDSGRRLAVAEGGCLLRDLDRATVPFNLACPSGVVSDTGLGGLALGGGYGWLARKWGLTCDHIVAAEVVLSDGKSHWIDDGNRSGLLRSLRGGHPSSTVVTQFVLRLRSIGRIYLRKASYSLDDARDVIESYGSFATSQPDELHAVGTLRCSPGGQKSRLYLTAVWLGNPGEGSAATARLGGRTKPLSMTEEVISYLQLQSMSDEMEPSGHRYFTKSCYLSGITGDVADQVVNAARRSPSVSSSIDFEYLLGAISKSRSNSAFPSRSAPYMCTASAHWTEPTEDDYNKAWARNTIDNLSNAHFGGVYSNYSMDEASSSSFPIP